MPSVDVAWLQDALVAVLQADTQVPSGETEIQPGDPRIKAAVNEVVLPLIESLGPDEIRRHEMGDAAVRFGPPGHEGLMIQTYIVSQHANLMREGMDGDLVDGGKVGQKGLCALGRGASQNKGPMAAALAAVRARPTNLSRPVWLTLNTEGRSSHGGSIRLIDDLGVKGSHGIIAFGTDLRVSLGNRGRIDVEVTVHGASSHSSQPWLGNNPIETAADVVTAIRELALPDPDERLGPATATPYQFACFPVAPHTIPQDVRIVVDRRLLPGESPDSAVDAVADHLTASGLKDVSVATGVSMLPAAVAEDSAIVRALLDGTRAAGRGQGETFWSLNAFDAGYACSKGILSPMYGPGKRSFAGPGLVGRDAVAIDDCVAGATAIAHAIAALCG